MKTKYKPATLLLGIIGLLVAQFGHADNSYGHISLIADGAVVCTVPISTSPIEKAKRTDTVPGCSIKYFDAIQLVDVPSAVIIKIRSFGVKADNGLFHSDCNEDIRYYPYRIDLKTVDGVIGAGTAIDFDTLMSAAVGRAVGANVRLLKRTATAAPWGPQGEYFACFKFEV